MTDERPSDDALAELDAYGMAATIEFEAKEKQALLELRSEEARLRQLSELFETTIRRLEESQELVELARSNGKIKF